MEMCMLYSVFGISLYNYVTNYSIHQQLGMSPIPEKMRERRFHQYGHIFRAASFTVAITYYLKSNGQRPCGQPKQRWQDTVSKDTYIVNLHSENANDLAKWCAKDPKNGSHLWEIAKKSTCPLSNKVFHCQSIWDWAWAVKVHWFPLEEYWLLFFSIYCALYIGSWFCF